MAQFFMPDNKGENTSSKAPTEALNLEASLKKKAAQ